MVSRRIPREQAFLRKSSKPPKITRKVDFSEPRLLAHCWGKSTKYSAKFSKDVQGRSSWRVCVRVYLCSSSSPETKNEKDNLEIGHPVFLCASSFCEVSLTEVGGPEQAHIKHVAHEQFLARPGHRSSRPAKKKYLCSLGSADST